VTWALALTAPGAEFKVAAELTLRNVPFHLFKIRKTVVRRGKVLQEPAAAFPKYIFVKVVAAELYRVLTETVREIVAFVRVGEDCWQGSIKALQETLTRADADGFLTIAPPPCRFAVGQRVLVRGNSVISGHFARFQNMLGDDQAIVEQEWLGRHVPILVRVSDLSDLESMPRRHKKKRRKHRSRRRCHSPQPLVS